MLRRVPLVILVLLTTILPSYAQFADCSTGLLQMPTAEMQKEATFMITNNFLNKNSLSKRWGYNTFQYGLSVSFWGRLEVGYVCTILNGAWDPRPDKTIRGTIIRNQDRHFTGRVLLLQEGDGFDWMPALVFGISDPTTGASGNDYMSGVITGEGNGYFNREFIVVSKHFNSRWGKIGAHAGYQFNRRTDYPINNPCFGIDFHPCLPYQLNFLNDFRMIMEFDSRTVNLGFIAAVWDDRFEAMFELQHFRWINFGLRYKLRLK